MNYSADVIEILAEILQLGLLRIRAYGWKGDSAQCAIEADHLHNLPALLSNFSEELVRFYWDVERIGFLSKANADAESAFGPLWKRLEPHVMMQHCESPTR